MTQVQLFLEIIYLLISPFVIIYLYKTQRYYKYMWNLEKENSARYSALYKIKHRQRTHVEYQNKNLQEQLNQKDKPNEKHYGC